MAAETRAIDTTLSTLRKRIDALGVAAAVAVAMLLALVLPLLILERLQERSEGREVRR